MCCPRRLAPAWAGPASQTDLAFKAEKKSATPASGARDCSAAAAVDGCAGEPAGLEAVANWDVMNEASWLGSEAVICDWMKAMADWACAGPRAAPALEVLAAGGCTDDAPWPEPAWNWAVMDEATWLGSETPICDWMKAMVGWANAAPKANPGDEAADVVVVSVVAIELAPCAWTLVAVDAGLVAWGRPIQLLGAMPRENAARLRVCYDNRR